jgi:hypothetical protein
MTAPRPVQPHGADAVQFRGQGLRRRPGPVGAAVVGDGDHGPEREAPGQAGHQPADARRQVALLVQDRDDYLHLRGPVRARLRKLMTHQALK